MSVFKLQKSVCHDFYPLLDAFAGVFMVKIKVWHRWIRIKYVYQRDGGFEFKKLAPI